jgi:hypothetical protein
MVSTAWKSLLYRASRRFNEQGCGVSQRKDRQSSIFALSEKSPLIILSQSVNRELSLPLHTRATINSIARKNISTTSPSCIHAPFRTIHAPSASHIINHRSSPPLTPLGRLCQRLRSIVHAILFEREAKYSSRTASMSTMPTRVREQQPAACFSITRILGIVSQARPLSSSKL